jgi:hypothetical protein
MWISLLSKYWKELVLLAGSALVVGYVMWLQNSLASIRLGKLEAEASLKMVTKQLENNYAEYELKLGRYETQSKVIETKWKTKYETIYVWGDENASCEDVITRFDSTVY